MVRSDVWFFFLRIRVLLLCLAFNPKKKKISFCRNLLLWHFPAFFSIVCTKQVILFARHEFNDVCGRFVYSADPLKTNKKNVHVNPCLPENARDLTDVGRPGSHRQMAWRCSLKSDNLKFCCKAALKQNHPLDMHPERLRPASYNYKPWAFTKNILRIVSFCGSPKVCFTWHVVGKYVVPFLFFFRLRGLLACIELWTKIGKCFCRKRSLCLSLAFSSFGTPWFLRNHPSL